MKCKSCNSKISVNYGNAYTTLCKNCSNTEEANNEVKNDKILNNKINKASTMKINRWVEALGITSSIFGVLFMIVRIVHGDFSSLFSGVLIITFGVAIYAFGNIIPYIVSIETSIRTLKDELTVKNKFSKDDQELK